MGSSGDTSTTLQMLLDMSLLDDCSQLTRTMLMASLSLTGADQEGTSSPTQWGDVHVFQGRALLLQTLWEITTTAPQPTVETLHPHNYLPLGIHCLMELECARAPAVTK